MEYQIVPESEAIELILKYSDETFNLREAIQFEILLESNPEYLQKAQINRKIRQQLKELPMIKTGPGFLERLKSRIDREC